MSPFWTNHIRQVLASLEITLSHVLFTLWHSDHTGGVPDLIAHRPECTAWINKCDPYHNQKAIVDRDIFRVKGATVRAVFTPGHAHDHICFELEEENALFTGDNILSHGQSVFEDLGLFTKSLWDMANPNCQLGYPAHGDMLRDLPQKMFKVIK
ncbi:hypothetical protein EYZ11_013545 [Aspergillus tanneri]|uniref:Metallo-beta-lactamase domain-containing protein n=1 Tax=Aspergillus tanneri TaxID=1220188 RepID=A0A4S3IZM0_9EURO|nr:hypothetical protein EYZ11_013545 [Aspergillus tanneri]